MLFSIAAATLLCALSTATPAPRVRQYDKVIQITPRAGPFAGGNNYYVSSVYDLQGGLGITTGKALAAHFSYQVVGKSKDFDLRLGNLLAEGIGYHETLAPNLVIAGRTLAGGRASPVNQPGRVLGNSFFVENGASESAVFHIDPATNAIAVISTVQPDFEVYYGACLRFSGNAPQESVSLPINEIQFYNRPQECQGDYTFVDLTLVSRG